MWHNDGHGHSMFGFGDGGWFTMMHWHWVIWAIAIGLIIFAAISLGAYVNRRFQYSRANMSDIPSSPPKNSKTE
jgi:hypothetical protein